MSDAEDGYTWLDAADEVLDAAVDEESVVECTAEDLELDVPLRFGEDAPFARWRFDGSVSVHVDGLRRPLAEWLRMWGEEVRDHEDRAEETDDVYGSNEAGGANAADGTSEADERDGVGSGGDD